MRKSGVKTNHRRRQDFQKRWPCFVSQPERSTTVSLPSITHDASVPSSALDGLGGSENRRFRAPEPCSITQAGAGDARQDKRQACQVTGTNGPVVSHALLPRHRRADPLSGLAGPGGKAREAETSVPARQGASARLGAGKVPCWHASPMWFFFAALSAGYAGNCLPAADAEAANPAGAPARRPLGTSLPRCEPSAGGLGTKLVTGSHFDRKRHLALKRQHRCPSKARCASPSPPEKRHPCGGTAFAVCRGRAFGKGGAAWEAAAAARGHTFTLGRCHGQSAHLSGSWITSAG